MPELPEVEVVRQGLDAVLRGLRLLRTEVRVPKLRWEVDPQLDALTRNQMVCALDRRSKVLLVALERGTLLIHLGMSGSLRRIQQPEALRTHDHLIWHFSGGLELRLHDPRRFGSVLWFAHPCVGSADSDPARSIDAHFARLGPEPFDPAFNADSLHRRSQGRKVAVKQWLMSGTPVVGVETFTLPKLCTAQALIRDVQLAGSGDIGMRGSWTRFGRSCGRRSRPAVRH